MTNLSNPCTCNTDRSITCIVHPHREAPLFSEPKLLNVRSMVMSAENLEKVYLEYMNNYITYEKFAEHEGLDLWFMSILIKAGREVHQMRVKLANDKLENQHD